MERFRLRVRNEPKRGHIWELHLFPQYPHRQLREVDARVLGSSSTPQAILWLRQLSDPFLLRSEEPSSSEKFGPTSEPCWLKAEDGMRMALAFSAARYLATPHQRRLFREGLEDLPHEVILYWFTLCFYGYRQLAGRAALRTLLIHEGPEEAGEESRKPNRRRAPARGPSLFAEANGVHDHEQPEPVPVDATAEHQPALATTKTSRDSAHPEKKYREAVL